MSTMLTDAGGTAEANEAPPRGAWVQRRQALRGGGAILLAVFLLSGASGLIYQVVWSRSLTLVFGSTTQGVATVLAAFMGGLALGSWLASRLGDRLADPLRVYGFLEAGIAALALAVLLLMPALDVAYRTLYPFAQLSLAALTLVRFVLASAFLLPATTLMGATLPVLSAYFERRGGVEGQGASTLYAVNTVGAVAGTATAGFWLLPHAGMFGATLVAACGNAVAAAGALLLARWAARENRVILIPFTGRERGPGDLIGPRSDPLPREARAGVAAALAMSGAAALILEVAWTRTLSLVLGSSTQAFTVMLTTFLIGLAAGSAVASRLLGRIRNPLGAFALAEMGVGVTVYIGVYLFPELPYAFIRLFRAASGSAAWFQAGRFALAGSVMLLPTLLLGATFPLAVRCWRLGTEDAARPVGRLYAVNTVGAIAGSLAAGFLLVPWIGLRQALITGALVNLTTGAFLMAISPTGRKAWRYALAGAVILLMPGLPLGAPEWNPLLMTSGVFQYASHYSRKFASRDEFIRYHGDHKQLYYRDGPTTTVTVEKRPARADGKIWLVLTVNGKVDASSVGDMETQVLIGQLPTLVSPDPRRVLVIGWGSGVTAGSVLTHSRVEQLRAVEIEPAVVEASHFFRDVNHDPYGDPRLQIEINDARHALLVDPGRYDVIISEPSNPWLAGPSRLFTREFFRLAKDRLAPGGILCQWIQLYGLDTESYKVLLRTLADVFADVVVFKGSLGDTIVMASPSPISLDVARMRERMREPAVAADLARVKAADPARILSRFRLGGDPLRAFAGEGPRNTDDNALIEFAAIRNLYRDTDYENDLLLAKAPSSPLDLLDLSGLSALESARFPVLLAREFFRAGLDEKAREALSRSPAGAALPAPAAAEAAALRGEMLQRDGRSEEARSAWDEALRADPDSLPALLSLGDHLLEKDRDGPAAEMFLRRARESHPDSAEAALGLGRSLLASGRAAEAVAALAAAATLAPPPAVEASIHMYWGRACFSAGDHDCAIRELTRYFRAWREVSKPARVSVDAALDLGRAYLATGKTALALEQFRVASDLGVSLAGWHKEQAEQARVRGDVDSVESHLREAVEWDARDRDAWCSLGDLLMRARRWSEAADVWSGLLVRQPDDSVGLGGLIEALRQQGRMREATSYLKRLIDVEEDPARIDVLREALQKASMAP